MKSIEKEVDKLIKNLEELSNEYNMINLKYGVYIESNEDGEFELYLTDYEMNNEEPTDINEDELYLFNQLETSSHEIQKEQLLDTTEFESLSLEELKDDLDNDSILEVKNTLKDKNEVWYNYSYNMTDLLKKNFKIIKHSADNLINLLNDEQQNIYKQRLDAVVSLEKTQVKKYINVREFTEIYGKSSDWQRLRRGRIKNKLPFLQEKRRGNILYKVEDVDNWFMNNS